MTPQTVRRGQRVRVEEPGRDAIAGVVASRSTLGTVIGVETEPGKQATFFYDAELYGGYGCGARRVRFEAAP